ncbi:ninja-family protein mc410 [Phtheirospermum japonicum]|uniref:Ninja-family protein n=1 Tax=Phtheirospermum japonicum TaxID=374723 RepID=A0A830C1N6_9LAMI|nr:ninja-family protein mc410 [Phtheirospermum japonicum]
MDKAKASHISITTDEGSTADNEDVAESEVDGSTSRQSGVEILGGQQKRFTISSEKEFNAMSMTNMGYSVPFPGQPVNIKDPSLTSYPLPSMMHGMGAINGEPPGVQPVMPANFPLMFGYAPVQLPSLGRDNSRGIGSVSHHQQMQSTYSGRNLVNPDTQNDSRKLTQATQYDGRAIVEHGKSYGKQQVGEEGSSSHTEGNAATHQTKDASDQPRAAESAPSEFPAIRPGIAADLKFGGCGSYPNLPWVSTTGQGPNGRTISGVTYKYSPTQIRIVCACHGTHMSPEEFLLHASAEENNTTDAGVALTPSSLPSSNPAASAQS